MTLTLIDTADAVDLDDEPPHMPSPEELRWINAGRARRGLALQVWFETEATQWD